MIGRKSSDELATQDGKSLLQEEIHEEVTRVLNENSDSGGIEVEEVFFTKFVMQ